jgi:hypothetical protein
MEEEGEDTLEKIFIERFESGSGRSLRSLIAVFLWRERRGEEKEEERKKEVGGKNGISDRAPTSLMPYRDQRALARVAPFVPTWHVPPPPSAGSLGRHYP